MSVLIVFSPSDSAFNPKDLISEAVCNVICSVILGQRFKSGDPQLELVIKALDGYFNILSSPLGQVLYSSTIPV